jgi:hypothetical protein
MRLTRDRRPHRRTPIARAARGLHFASVMFSAIEWQDGSVTRLDDDDPWGDDPTVVIPAEQLEQLREVIDDGDGSITQRMDPIPELLAVGSMTELPRAPVSEEVVSFHRAPVRSVTAAPEAERTRAWLVGLVLALLVVEILALSW